jgi:hypothetical protein
LPNFSIPIGIFHLFWSYFLIFQIDIFHRYDKKQINEFVAILNQLKKGIYIQITITQKTFFESLSIHKNLLEDLSEINSTSHRDNFPPSRQTIQLNDPINIHLHTSTTFIQKPIPHEIKSQFQKTNIKISH